MPPATISSKFWRDRAADMRTLSDESDDPATKHLLLQMADDYETFAVQRDLPIENTPQE